MENELTESEDDAELVESEEDSSSPIPQRQRPRSTSRTHRLQQPVDPNIASIQQRGRATEKIIQRPTFAPMGGGNEIRGFGGTCRARSRLRMTESQILEKLGSIVSDGHPSEKYTTLERIGHG